MLDHFFEGIDAARAFTSRLVPRHVGGCGSGGDDDAGGGADSGDRDGGGAGDGGRSGGEGGGQKGGEEADEEGRVVRCWLNLSLVVNVILWVAKGYAFARSLRLSVPDSLLESTMDVACNLTLSIIARITTRRRCARLCRSFC